MTLESVHKPLGFKVPTFFRPGRGAGRPTRDLLIDALPWSKTSIGIYEFYPPGVVPKVPGGLVYQGLLRFSGFQGWKP